jgi:hypothetical protein
MATSGNKAMLKIPKPGDVCACTILGANNGRDISSGIEAARVLSEQRQRAVQQ